VASSKLVDPDHDTIDPEDKQQHWPGLKEEVSKQYARLNFIHNTMNESSAECNEWRSLDRSSEGDLVHLHDEWGVVWIARSAAEKAGAESRWSESRSPCGVGSGDTTRMPAAESNKISIPCIETTTPWYVNAFCAVSAVKEFRRTASDIPQRKDEILRTSNNTPSCRTECVFDKAAEHVVFSALDQSKNHPLAFRRVIENSNCSALSGSAKKLKKFQLSFVAIEHLS